MEGRRAGKKVLVGTGDRAHCGGTGDAFAINLRGIRIFHYKLIKADNLQQASSHPPVYHSVRHSLLHIDPSSICQASYKSLHGRTASAVHKAGKVG